MTHDPNSRATGEIATPSDLYGALFEAVQLRRIFADGKTFADALGRFPPAEIVRAFEAERPGDDAALRAFVVRHFDMPCEDAAASRSTSPAAVGMRARIAAIWAELAREPNGHRIASSDGATSELPLPSRFVVPGGRFRELYYWDSYFTMLGLRADGEEALIEAMLDNFTTLIERHGHIPNGSRSYFLSRSQPPAYHLMCGLSTSSDSAIRRRRVAAMRAEHDYWMRGENEAEPGGAVCRVVRLPDGAVLNRYWDARDTPRDESYREDVRVAARADRTPQIIYRDLRAGAESGWDFSSRWLDDGGGLETIRTTAIVPVDLNSLLFGLEQAIARDAGDDAVRRCFASKAEARARAMRDYLWDEARGCFVDYDWSRCVRREMITAAMLTPLWLGLATPDQARRTARLVEQDLIAPGGLRTTTVRSGEQWDAPNGWAPLQWIAVEGLERHGMTALAGVIASRWLETVAHEFADSGRFLEKYDVENGRPGQGGEYPLQLGFGWTNGVTAALFDRYAGGLRL